MSGNTNSSSSSFNIRVLNRGLMKASDPSFTPYVLPLNTNDMTDGDVMAMYVCIYPKPPPSSGGFQAVVALFESKFPLVLNEFPPCAGRIASYGALSSSSLPEIICANQGAELVVGEADAALADIDFHDMKNVIKLMIPQAKDLVLSVQLVSYTCGGFSVGWSGNSMFNDGYTCTKAISAWSELNQSGKVLERWSFDRSLVKARDVPKYRPEIADLYTPYSPDNLVNVLTIQESTRHRLYHVSAADARRLMSVARTGDQRQRPTTRTEAVTAYLWKVMGEIIGTADDHCRLICWVNGRHRMQDPAIAEAMKSYYGGVVVPVSELASTQEIREKSILGVAMMVREMVEKADNEYIQEVTDWMEAHKGTHLDKGCIGLGSPTLTVNSYLSLSPKTDFGFGKAPFTMLFGEEDWMCSSYVQVLQPEGGDGSWLVSIYGWPMLHSALVSDPLGFFKPFKGEHLFAGRVSIVSRI